MSIPKYDSEANLRKKDQMVIRCLRTTGAFAPMPDDVVEFVYSWLEGPEKFATILMDKVHQWLLLDRYERRALSCQCRTTLLGDAPSSFLDEPSGENLDFPRP